MTSSPDMLRLVVAALMAVAGIATLIVKRRERGFGQGKQAGALFLVGAVVFALLAFRIIG